MWQNVEIINKNLFKSPPQATADFNLLENLWCQIDA